jgi:hypothetical protein
MAIVSYISWKLSVRPGVPAYEAVVPVTYAYLRHSCLQDCGKAAVGIQYGIIVAIIFQMKWQARQNVKLFLKAV